MHLEEEGFLNWKNEFYGILLGSPLELEVVLHSREVRDKLKNFAALVQDRFQIGFETRSSLIQNP